MFLFDETRNNDVREALAQFDAFDCTGNANVTDASETTEICECVLAQVVNVKLYACENENESFYVIDIFALCDHVFDMRDLHDTRKDERTKLVKTFRVATVQQAHEIICALSYNVNVLN